MKLRLRDPLGVFYDPETRLRIRMKQVVEVTDMGRLTRDWLNSGGLVIVKDKPENSDMGQTVVTVCDPMKEGTELPVLVVPPPLFAEKDPKPARRKRRNTRKL